MRHFRVIRSFVSTTALRFNEQSFTYEPSEDRYYIIGTPQDGVGQFKEFFIEKDIDMIIAMDADWVQEVSIDYETQKLKRIPKVTGMNMNLTVKKVFNMIIDTLNFLVDEHNANRPK